MMRSSFDDLRINLNNKGDKLTLKNSHFQDIIDNIEKMYIERNSGSCPAHIKKTKYDNLVSYNHLQDEINKITACKCNTNIVTECDCVSRTGTSICNANLCDCVSRTSELICSENVCECKSRTYSSTCDCNACDCELNQGQNIKNLSCTCQSRTSDQTCQSYCCNCVSRGPFESCTCYNVAGVAGACTGFKYNKTWCDCNIEGCTCAVRGDPCSCNTYSHSECTCDTVTKCTCNIDCGCVSRTHESTCYCNTDCSCVSRTTSSICDCNVNCYCESRTASDACSCNTLCTCNVQATFE